MLYFNVSIRIAIVITMIAIILNIALCFIKSNYQTIEKLKNIIAQLRGIGTLYFLFAWFMGNGGRVTSSRTTYEQVAYWLLIASIGWLVVFVVTLLSKLWSREENLTMGALVCGSIYFILAFLLH